MGVLDRILSWLAPALAGVIFTVAFYMTTGAGKGPASDGCEDRVGAYEAQARELEALLLAEQR